VETATLKVVTGNNVETTVPAGRTFVIGRARTADIVITDTRVSRRHLVVEAAGDEWSVRDVSANGTWLDGRRIETHTLSGEARFRLGAADGPEVLLAAAPSALAAVRDYDPSHEMPTMLGGGPRVASTPRQGSGPRGQGYAQVPSARGAGGPGSPEAEPMETGDGHIKANRSAVHQIYAGTTTIGRGLDNTIVLADLLASRHHAQLNVTRDTIEIIDLTSANGTFVNGQRVEQAVLTQRDIIAVGHHLFLLEGSTLVESTDAGDVSFEAQGLNVWAGKKQIMHDVSFRLPERSLLAVVGPSGAGKSTLLNAITGFRPADAGTVRYAGRDMYSDYDELRRRIGYVPQEDLLHSALTVRKALEFAAELRFPPDVTGDERRVRVDEVLGELGLSKHADTTVSRLSGGQRKRTSVALELLTKPSLLYLDEPTSGLDPGMDKSVMQTLRNLADDGRTVVVVTHSVTQLDLCDYVLVLAPGGYVAYFGPPKGALSFFGKKDFPDVFIHLEATPGEESAARFRSSDLFVPSSVIAPSARPAPEELPSLRQQSVLSQLSTLSRRYLCVVTSDRSYLRLIIAFPFLLGLIPRVIPAKNGFDALKLDVNRDAATLLLIMTLCACFMGMANSVREIVKERPIYRRERGIGLSRTAYLGSKVLVLSLITSLQCIVFTMIGVLGRTPKGSVALGSSLAEITVAIIAVAIASAMLGLVISTLVDSADKTMPLLVLITMAQLVFCGGLVPTGGKIGLDQVSWLTPARWGFAGLASATDLNVIGKFGVPGFKQPDADPLWNHTASTYWTDIGLALAVGTASVFLCAWLLRRIDPKTARRK
jgi:ABC-type multidrug transport system ATPase subunit